jgi:hypothetical protein
LGDSKAKFMPMQLGSRGLQCSSEGSTWPKML